MRGRYEYEEKLDRVKGMGGEVGPCDPMSATGTFGVMGCDGEGGGGKRVWGLWMIRGAVKEG